jgi:hypothetical protein
MSAATNRAEVAEGVRAARAIQLVGRYHDTLHHDDGTWRFHCRVAKFVTSHSGQGVPTDGLNW